MSGADDLSTRRYPWRGEPIVPRLLRGLVLERRAPSPRTDADSELLARVDLGVEVWKRLSPQTCRRLSLIVVDRVRTSLPSLPAVLRSALLPSPTLALGLPLERRTRNALRRGLRRPAASEAWTLERYLAIPRFGARALLDLLACLEAHESGMSAAERALVFPASTDHANLGRAIVAIARKVPASEEQIRRELACEGFDVAGTDLSDMLRTAVALGWDAPFRLVDIAGSRVVMRPGDVTAAKAAYRIAVRVVHSTGMATFPAVVAQLQARMEIAVDEGFVRQVLMAMSSFCWLSQADGWFWFAGRANPLLVAVRKILSVTKRIALWRLGRALVRTQAELAHVPAATAQIAKAVPEARVVGDEVVADRPLDPHRHLNRCERQVLRMIDSYGPLSVKELRDVARREALPWPAVWKVVTHSPIIEQSAAGHYQPVGWNGHASELMPA